MFSWFTKYKPRGGGGGGGGGVPHEVDEVIVRNFWKEPPIRNQNSVLWLWPKQILTPRRESRMRQKLKSVDWPLLPLIFFGSIPLKLPWYLQRKSIEILAPLGVSNHKFLTPERYNGHLHHHPPPPPPPGINQLSWLYASLAIIWWMTHVLRLTYTITFLKN